MKSIHEILIIVKERYKEYPVHPTYKNKTIHQKGICNTIQDCYYTGNAGIVNGKTLTKGEALLAIRYLIENAPKHVSQKDKHRGSDEMMHTTSYFWNAYVRRPRLMWLTKHINLTRP